MVAARRRTPREDLISALVAVKEEGDRLSEQELISLCVLLLIAGHETTANLLGNGMLALLRHPEQRRRLCDNPSLTEGAVEEMLRYDAPVQVQPPAVAQDLELRGITLRRHDVVLPMLGAANRDPEAFREPDEFDIDRQSAPGVRSGGPLLPRRTAGPARGPGRDPRAAAPVPPTSNCA